MEIDKLSEALAKAQGKIVPPVKNRKVDFLDKNNRRVHYNYADLADVIECCRLPLSENGLSIIHQMEPTERGLGMTTSLLHSSGQRITTFYPLPHPADLKPQEFGSAITYARRYSLSALLGIASEEDDDGAEAVPPEKSAPKQASQPQAKHDPPRTPTPLPKPKPVTDETPHVKIFEPSDAQLKRLFAIASAHNWSNDQVKIYLDDKFGISSTRDLTRVGYEQLCSVIERFDFETAMHNIQK